MARNRFDVIIVGARCAGAALAVHLARAGATVALVEAGRLPSGQRTSTHLIMPPGMDELDGLGLGGLIRQEAPALTSTRLSFDGHEAQLPFARGRAAHCLRRERLDPLLQEAAVRSSVDLHPRTRVTAVLKSSDSRVRGVVVRREGGRTERLFADLVVGADGRGSTIAKLVKADEYLAYDGPRSCYWAYWRRPPDWNQHQVCNFYAGDDAFVVFPTDEDQLLIASAPPLDRAREWRRDHADAYRASVASYREINAHLAGQAPESEVRAVFRTRYFFRTSAGPGWALIGDAGHHKEFFLGLGISDALRDARQLSLAIAAGEKGAIEKWWRTRDVQRVELFRWGRELGRADSVDALERLLARRLASNPEHGRLGDVIEGHVSPFDLVSASRAFGWVVAAVIAGDLQPIRPLVASAMARFEGRSELRKRTRMVPARSRRHRIRSSRPSCSSGPRVQLLDADGDGAASS